MRFHRLFAACVVVLAVVTAIATAMAMIDARRQRGRLEAAIDESVEQAFASLLATPPAGASLRVAGLWAPGRHRADVWRWMAYVQKSDGGPVIEGGTAREGERELLRCRRTLLSIDVEVAGGRADMQPIVDRVCAELDRRGITYTRSGP